MCVPISCHLHHHAQMLPDKVVKKGLLYYDVQKQAKHCFLVFLFHVFWLQCHDGGVQGSIF